MSQPPSTVDPSSSDGLRTAKKHLTEIVPLSALRTERRNARHHTRAQIRSIARSIEAFGFNAPILIDGQNGILAGHGRYEAAKLLRLTEVPVVRLSHLNEQQARAYMLADNRLSDRSNWDEDTLAIELKELSDSALNFDIDATGFEQAEIDLRIQSLDAADIDEADEFEPPGQAVSRVGDLWTLGPHRILCGDSIDEASYAILMPDDKAAAVFSDAPFNVPVNGHVRGKGRRRHREFAMATGELSDRQFERFLSDFLANCVDHCEPGALIYACMDWRHMNSMAAAGDDNGLQLINLCVWVKTNGGLGSLYRSRHELVFVFRNGSDSPHKNNVQLGRFGRNRTNVWNYAGANVFRRENSGDEFDSHPTVKPVRLVADALLDSTHRGDIVLDPFLGSGTTAILPRKKSRCRQQ